MIRNFHMSSNLTRLLISYSKERGLGAGALQKRINAEGNSSSGKRMRYQSWCSYLTELYALADGSMLSITLGRGVQPEHCGVLWYLSLNCANLGEALMRFERYQRLLYDGGLGITELSADRICFSWPSRNGNFSEALSDEVLLFGLGSFVQRMFDVNHDYPINTGFSHSPIAQPSEYRHAMIGGEVEFNASNLYIEFTADYLSMQISNSDASLKMLLERQAQTLLSVLPNDSLFENQLQQALLAMLQHAAPSSIA